MVQTFDQVIKKDVAYNKENYTKKYINKIINKIIRQNKSKNKNKRAIKKKAKCLFWCFGFDLEQIKTFVILELAKIWKNEKLKKMIK